MGGAVATLNGLLRRAPVWPFYGIGFIPAAWWFYAAFTDRLGADPVARLEHELGLVALQLLIAALAVTPLRELAGVNLLRFRRMIGLMAFYYVMMHVGVWLVFDRQLDWPRILADLYKRPYIVVGAAAALMLLPLALTSTDAAIRRLGPMAWRRLHRLAYPAAALAALHFVWLVKAWPPEPFVYASIVAGLLGWRALRGRRQSRMRAAPG